MISIVIPVYNQHEMTMDCLRAVREHTQDCEIILVDNGSTPALDRPYTGFMDCCMIRNDANMGFPWAVNQGIAVAKGDIIVLLNNDVIVTPGWATRLVRALQNPDDPYSIVGPTTNFAAGIQRVDVGLYENEADLARESELLAAHWQDATEPVNWVIGFCMAFPKALWDELGPFDESLWPCSGEEIDFCLRARKAGHRVGVVRGCYVHHEGSQTFKALDEDYQTIVERNEAHLAERWGPEWSRQRVDPGEVGGVRLNLGCGRFPLRGGGWVNIDQEASVEPDLVADVLELPYAPESVDEIYAGHLLEHFDWRDGERALAHWFSLLRPGGRIGVAVPDFDVLAARYVEAPSAEALRELNDLYIYSYRQKSPHKYAYSGPLLQEALAKAGFVYLERMPITHPYFPYPVDWQVGIMGVRP